MPVVSARVLSSSIAPDVFIASVIRVELFALAMFPSNVARPCVPAVLACSARVGSGVIFLTEGVTTLAPPAPAAPAEPAAPAAPAALGSGIVVLGSGAGIAALGACPPKVFNASARL